MVRVVSVTELVLVSLFLTASLARDSDRDGIDDDKDSCPFDRYNDKDSDGMCALDSCWDNPEFSVIFSGAKCSHFRPGEKGYGKCAQYHKDGLANVCRSCSCTCAHEAACGFDPCPGDAQNDADKDGICGDIDSCPLDKDNDLDSDGICGDVDSCLLDAENDADSDKICGDVDSCPHDTENDADNDLLCGDEDTCPYDALNDIDSDSICNDKDSCPMDRNNDEDGDNLCAMSECYDKPKFVSRKGYACPTYAHEPRRCALESIRLSSTSKQLSVCVACGCACAHESACGFDPCPLDKENDADSDNLCADEDVCPHDASNDADSDNICGNLDSCPMDKENDLDSDNLCDIGECFDDMRFLSASGYSCAEYAAEKGFCKAESTAELDVCKSCGCACAGELACGSSVVDICPNDAHNDKDSDDLCGDVDPCPLDKENDADSDNLCADKDVCPNESSNDVDSDNICESVDSCPMDRENDKDSDSVCGDKDKCPHDPENDIDDDLICADEDSCPYDADNDLDSDNLCARDDKCPTDEHNDADSDSVCDDVDRCPHDTENDVDGDMLCADVDPCPYDFRAPVDDRCNEARLHFSQLDSLQAVRETFPAAALTADCPWSGARTALSFQLGRVQCIRAVQAFRLHTATKTLTGSLAITADINWTPDQQKRLMRYIASVVRVMPGKIVFSHSSKGHLKTKGKFIGRRSLSRLHTVTIGVEIRLDDLPFRPLRCRDSTACNYNEDTSALFNASNTSATDFCIFSEACKTTARIRTSVSPTVSTNKSNSTLKSTGAISNVTPGSTPRQHDTKPWYIANAYPKTDCQMDYVYLGIGIGAGGSLVVVLICFLFGYCCLRCAGYRLKKSKKSKKSKKKAQPKSKAVGLSKPSQYVKPDEVSIRNEYLGPDEISVRRGPDEISVRRDEYAKHDYAKNDYAKA